MIPRFNSDGTPYVPIGCDDTGDPNDAINGPLGVSGVLGAIGACANTGEPGPEGAKYLQTGLSINDVKYYIARKPSSLRKRPKPTKGAFGKKVKNSKLK